jgi:hypothetical protein
MLKSLREKQSDERLLRLSLSTLTYRIDSGIRDTSVSAIALVFIFFNIHDHFYFGLFT